MGSLSKPAEVARLVGGAGTGKTTAILGKMEMALERLGGDPLRLGFASMTRAARAEAVGRASKAWGVSEGLLSKQGWFRTVHSCCYRLQGLSGGQLLTDKQADLEWISDAMGVKVQASIDEDTGAVTFSGDPEASAALNCWALARSMLVPVELVVRNQRRVDDSLPDFAKIKPMLDRYETAKRVGDRIDFVDLLAAQAGVVFSVTENPHIKKGNLPPVPEVSAWLFDEQQDASPLLDLVCKRFVAAPSVRWCYVVGDPFQSIYGFAGSNSECFMGWSASKEQTMPKSYRCPAPILRLGEQCLRRMRRGYFDRGIEPADHPGRVDESGDLDELVDRINPNDSWLLIARTRYQAGRLAAAMHGRGKPCRWTNAPEGPTHRSDGLQALFKLERGEPISGLEWRRATELLPSNGMLSPGVKQPMLIRGTKKRFSADDEMARWDFILPSDLPNVGASPALQAAIASGAWEKLVDHADTWRKQAKSHGMELAAEPKCRVGTIHSVKGMEADNVAFLTTTSARVQNGSEDERQHDEECRIAYVAVTRARRNLVVINEGRYSTPKMEVL
jgi:superfamily I DNA/RNA helicase